MTTVLTKRDVALADLLVLIERSFVPALRAVGLHDVADGIVAETTRMVAEPENATAVAYAREKLGFRWMEE